MRRSLGGVAAAVLLVTGCGAVEDEPADLAGAVAQTRAKESSQIEVRGQEDRDGKAVPVTCAGAADYARKMLDVLCDYGREDGAFAMRAIAGAIYVRGGEGHGKWQKFPDDEDELVSDISPERLLSMLRDASVDTERVGEEAVRGTPAVRYRLRVNCEQAELTDCSGGTAPVEVWIGGDDVVRRISLEDAGFSGTIEFFDFGLAVDIESPPADQVEDVRELLGRTCEPEGGTPIRASRAIEALRRAGFSVKIELDACFGDVVAAIDNTGLPRVLEREGVVMCHVYDKPPATATGRVVRQGVDGGDAELVLANLECMLFTDRPDPEPAIERLEQAFRELER